MTIRLPAVLVFVMSWVVIVGGLLALLGSVLHGRARAAMDARYRISLAEVKRKYGMDDDGADDGAGDGADEGHGQVDTVLVVVLVVLLVLVLLGRV